MPLDDNTIDRIATLARLQFTGSEKEEIRQDLSRILKFVDKISEVDTEGVEALIYVNEGEDKLREDIVNHVVSQGEALENAPDKDSDYIRVPRVLKKG